MKGWNPVWYVYVPKVIGWVTITSRDDSLGGTLNKFWKYVNLKKKPSGESLQSQIVMLVS